MQAERRCKLKDFDRHHYNPDRVRIPAESRAAADGLCQKIRGVGGACIVLRT